MSGNPKPKSHKKVKVHGGNDSTQLVYEQGTQANPDGNRAERREFNRQAKKAANQDTTTENGSD